MAIPVPEKRIAEFENFGFGMFVHWGLYAQLGRGTAPLRCSHSDRPLPRLLSCRQFHIPSGADLSVR